jgi:diguanylate cyclase
MQNRSPVSGLGWLRRRAAFPSLPESVIVVPVITLISFWLGGEVALVGAALGLPLMALALAHFQQRLPATHGATDGGSLRQRLTEMLDAALLDAAQMGKSTACLILRMDDAARFRELYGSGVEAEVLAKCADRFIGALRQGDLVVRMPDCGFGLGFAAGHRLDLETMIQLVARLQATVSMGISVQATTHYLSFSGGFCLGARAPFQSGEALLNAADLAASDASVHGPGAIRAYTPDLALRQRTRDSLLNALETALQDGQIRPYFQPQISTDTGSISGFEALARWHHPERGVISPCDFIPLIDSAGLSERLAEVMLFHSMTALNAWDRAGVTVPSVGINFSTTDLSNPTLVEKLKWELDRFNLAPARLSVEILETVVANTDNDISVRNIAALADLGCGIDLDDFGTGNASIGSIRRFDVRRIKIDRSFVTHVDADRGQQRMISALVSLADRLGLDTVAEGVETGAEHAMLAQLGCRHVQGFGIARPMPFDETLPWIAAHQAAQAVPPRIGNRAVGT